MLGYLGTIFGALVSVAGDLLLSIFILLFKGSVVGLVFWLLATVFGGHFPFISQQELSFMSCWGFAILVCIAARVFERRD